MSRKQTEKGETTYIFRNKELSMEVTYLRPEYKLYNFLHEDERKNKNSGGKETTCIDCTISMILL